MRVGDGEKVAPPGDGGRAKGSEVLVNDRNGSGGGPSGEADASEGFVVLNQASKGPHRRGNILANAVNEPGTHGEEESGGRRLGGGGVVSGL